MPDNKSLDGIKKLSEQDLKKARDVVLQSIGEKSKTAKPIGGISQDEARKIEAATEKFKPKQVDGLVVRRKTENRRQKTDGRKQTADNGYVFVSADSKAVADDSVQDKEKLVKAKAEQLKLKWQRMREKKTTEKRQRLEQIEQVKHKDKKTKRQKKFSFATYFTKVTSSAVKTRRRTTNVKKAMEDKEKNKKVKPKRQKQTRSWLGERRADAQPRLLITCYLLLVLTIIIIVACVGFFTIWYNLNNYAGLFKVSKIQQMMESGANFYQIAKSQGDEFGVGKYYTYNEATVKFGQNIVNLETGQISIIKHTDSGYYLVQCFGRKENLIGLKFIFVKGRSLDDYVSEMMAGFRLYK